VRRKEGGREKKIKEEGKGKRKGRKAKAKAKIFQTWKFLKENKDNF
jgi:hypothetical protein